MKGHCQTILKAKLPLYLLRDVLQSWTAVFNILSL